MSDRGHDLLLLASLPINDPQRDTAWLSWCAHRPDTKHRSFVRDFLSERKFVTTDDYRTMELTAYGHMRLEHGRKLRAERSV